MNKAEIIKSLSEIIEMMKAIEKSLNEVEEEIKEVECDHRWTDEAFSKEEDAMISICIKCGAKFKRTLNPSSQAEDTNMI